MIRIDEINQNWNFFYCEEMALGFFYCDQRPTLHDISKKLSVHCLILNRKVSLQFIGTGKIGFDKLNSLHLDSKIIFPVNLFSNPHKIDPKPSRKVSEEEYDTFCQIVGGVKQQELIASRYNL